VTTIREIMHECVVTIHPEETVATAIDILTRHHIGGLPVVNKAGGVVGMISELALIDVVFDLTVRCAPISKYMTTDVQVVHADDPLSRVAQLFALYSFRRVPVVECGKLVGIVTRRDLMNHALRTNEVLVEPLIELIPSLAPMS
jgi:CBS domain-containing protein